MDSTDRLGLVACLRRGLDARLRGLDAVLTGTSGLDAVAARGRGSLTQSLSHIHTCDLNEQQMNRSISNDFYTLYGFTQITMGMRTWRMKSAMRTLDESQKPDLILVYALF